LEQKNIETQEYIKTLVKKIDQQGSLIVDQFKQMDKVYSVVEEMKLGLKTHEGKISKIEEIDKKISDIKEKADVKEKDIIDMKKKVY